MAIDAIGTSMKFLKDDLQKQSFIKIMCKINSYNQGIKINLYYNTERN